MHLKPISVSQEFYPHSRLGFALWKINIINKVEYFIDTYIMDTHHNFFVETYQK